MERVKVEISSKTVLVILGIIAVIYAGYMLHSVLLLFLLAYIFSSALKPLVNFFEKYKLIVKQKDFQLFKKVVNLILQKKHLTKKGFNEILEIAFKMNANGKQRKYSKEYILETASIQLSD